MAEVADSKYFWRIIIEEDGKPWANAEGHGDTAKIAAKMLCTALQSMYMYNFPKENGHTILIKTIFERIEKMT